jgi:predicted AlkP superfamily pyrophosphatase or phosphodiesterase
MRHATRRARSTLAGAKGVALAIVIAIGAVTPASFAPATAGTARSSLVSAVGAMDLGTLACRNLGVEVLARTLRGIHPDRSGDVVMIPWEPNFVNGGLTHATPFDYTQDVPLFLYGPGRVRPGVYHEPVTLADLAPTQAALLDFPFPARDGSAQRQALLPSRRRTPPRLIVTVVWDSVGDNVLRRWPDAWPVLAGLRSEGAWFEEATVGASPSNTPVSHATIGTGAFPAHHGFVDVYLRIGERLLEPNALGPQTLLVPTLADRYDAAFGNVPIVGAVATLSEQLMMMGQGSAWPGGDRDLAVTRVGADASTSGAESDRWNLAQSMSPYYELPEYANDASLDSYVTALDRADGALDGRWRENDIASLAAGFDTPARTPYEEALVEELVLREGFGADDVPDLLFVNFKVTDTIGHRFTADGIEMADAVASQDAALGQLISFLDATVGAGEWVLALVADHGTQFDPDVSGAFMISADRLRAGLAETFDGDDDGVPLVQKLRPSQIWLDRAELADNGFTLEQVSQWLLGLTEADTATASSPPETGRGDDFVFAAALPSSSVADLSCLRPTGPG